MAVALGHATLLAARTGFDVATGQEGQQNGI
jgi:hypothetical protein